MHFPWVAGTPSLVSCFNFPSTCLSWGNITSEWAYLRAPSWPTPTIYIFNLQNSFRSITLNIICIKVEKRPPWTFPETPDSDASSWLVTVIWEYTGTSNCHHNNFDTILKHGPCLVLFCCFFNLFFGPFLLVGSITVDQFVMPKA